jgi:hypothetical protein
MYCEDGGVGGKNKKKEDVISDNAKAVWDLWPEGEQEDDDRGSNPSTENCVELGCEPVSKKRALDSDESGDDGESDDESEVESPLPINGRNNVIGMKTVPV